MIPNYGDKYDAEAIFSPDDAVSVQGEGVPDLPPAVILGYQDELTDAGFETPQGTTWTTSAMYRETLPEIEQYHEDGVVSLCMESAAIWAVGQYRGVDTATVHHIGDYLTTDEWVPEADKERGLDEKLAPTVSALEEHLASDAE